MKKQLLLTIGVLLLLGGCSEAKEEQQPNYTTDNISISEEMSAVQTIFIGTIHETTDTSDSAGNRLIFLQESETVADTDNNILATFKEFGVGVNVNSEQVENLEEWTSGQRVQVTLAEHAIMTASIPPQLAGNSVEDIKLLP